MKLENPVQVHTIETVAVVIAPTPAGGEQTCASLVIATGGLSIPKRSVQLVLVMRLPNN
ncbi:MAG: hypothetical protein P0107_04580 [Nitrosomonas sp.]|nr:hypothetical protein [Nitrosomonas sp.]